jgi:hypothetical protein
VDDRLPVVNGLGAAANRGQVGLDRIHVCLAVARLVVGDEAATARPRPVVGGAKIGAGHSAHAGLARSAMSVRPRRNRPARVRARPLTEPMNARYSTGHTPIISGDVETRMLPPINLLTGKNRFQLVGKH